MRLSMELVMASSDPARVRLTANALCTLAAEARNRDDCVVPPHLRIVPGDMPESVVSLDAWRAQA